MADANNLIINAANVTVNGTGSDSGSGGNDNNDVLNWVALVVSLVALLGTVAQVLQQYYASAAGYSNCGESVMGEWHKSKSRKFRLTELRFEVQFEAPVIFVCPPSNTKGPVKNEPIHFIRGTKESLANTRALLPQDEEKHRLEALKENQVHTADNERATWVTLLSQLQYMEKQSADWQDQQLKNNGPRNPLPSLAQFEDHSLAIAVQSKKRSWDTMPLEVRKPYATTAMCHLLEIAAMMGIYWKEFDRSKDKYRAEGNGYMLTGEQARDLGLMFTFRISGKSHFEENRVIPVDEVKELCCGYASTIFKETKDNRRVEFPNEESKDLGLLQLGSMAEIAETMVLMECNTNTANYFRQDGHKHTHLFPVPFELLGMLGKTLHIRNSCYRMLPNPTPCQWDKNFFNLRKLVKEYANTIQEDEALPQIPQIRALEDLALGVVSAIKRDKNLKIPGYSMHLLNTLHDALDKCDEYLRFDRCDDEKAKADRRDLVQMVLREHFQEILKMINDPEDDKVMSNPAQRVGEDSDPEKRRARQFHELSAANPEERQVKFMDIYFYTVLDQVRDRAVQSLIRRQSSTRYAPSTHERESSVDSAKSATMKAASAPSTPTLTAVRPASPRAPLRTYDSTHSAPLLQLPHDGSKPLFPDEIDTELGQEAAAIWCTLVFRMLCWLLLHDFHKKDVQIPKSELLGSRLPVYIA
ncbi:hypothetical protein B0H66DRAFT_604036 [Apodospora peruviana]|uniref:Modin n=1 Tax=Apodospora peruviana TaxID=516989 RepID=A0AAE0M1U2_9PEZI|nr:hypothetical protein B0H66DRAFT_604036 [Apodospora peruviana]